MPKMPQRRSSEELYISAEDADVIDLFTIRRSFNPDGTLRYVQVIGNADELDAFANNRPIVVTERIVNNPRIFGLMRLVMQRKLGRPLEKSELVVPVNGKNGDCRRSNLELTTRSELAQHERGTWSESGEKYVYAKDGGRFYASVLGSYLGTFDTAEQAAQAVKLYFEFIDKGMTPVEAARRVKGRSRNTVRFNIE